jgi:hypothetical protein
MADIQEYTQLLFKSRGIWRLENSHILMRRHRKGDQRRHKQLLQLGCGVEVVQIQPLNCTCTDSLPNCIHTKVAVTINLDSLPKAVDQVSEKPFLFAIKQQGTWGILTKEGGQIGCCLCKRRRQKCAHYLAYTSLQPSAPNPPPPTLPPVADEPLPNIDEQEDESNPEILSHMHINFYPMDDDVKQRNALQAAGLLKYPAVLSPDCEECKHGNPFTLKLVGQACIVNLVSIICETIENGEVVPILVMKATTNNCSCEEHYQGESENLINVNDTVLISYAAVSYMTLNWVSGGTLHQFSQLIFDNLFYTSTLKLPHGFYSFKKTIRAAILGFMRLTEPRAEQRYHS